MSPWIRAAAGVVSVSTLLAACGGGPPEERSPRIVVDHGHHNYHRIDGTLAGTADILRRHGYEVLSTTSPVTPGSLTGADVFVIGNPFAEPRDSLVNLDVPPASWRWNERVAREAFTGTEAVALRAWVEGGGGVLVLADHAPHGVTLRRIAEALGVTLHNVETSDTTRSPDGYPWGIWFTRADGSIGEHPVTRGVDSVLTTLGQSIQGPPGSTDLLRLSARATDSWWDFDAGGRRRGPAGGSAQGVAFELGSGRVVFMGEAGWAAPERGAIPGLPEGLALPADTASSPATDSTRDRWVFPGKGNRDLLLNAVAWLAGAGPQAVAPDSLQARIDWLEEHAVPIRTIDPEDADFSDLMPLSSVLEDVRLVLLGEQSHADGATFVAKHRLVRFLHQELGFRLLAFEANREVLRLLDQDLGGGTPLDTVADMLPGMWGESAYVRELLRYARETRGGDHPLRLAGFDIQVGADARAAYRRTLRALIDSVAPELAGGAEVLRVDSALMPEGPLAAGAGETSPEAHVRALRHVEELEERLPEPAGSGASEAADHLSRLLEDVSWALRYVDHRDHGSDERWTAVRDEAMAENLLWLLERGAPQRRVVGWGHSGHIARRLTDVEVLDGTLSWEDETPMGGYLSEELGGEVYSVGFLAFEGASGQVFPDTSFVREIQEAPTSSLDWLLGRLGEPYLFLDLRSVPQDHWLRRSLVARPVYRDMEAVWPEVYDGFVFTREMFPNRRVAPLAGGG